MLDPPTDAYRFCVLFECHALSPDDLEWKFVCLRLLPGNEELGQELDSCLVGPIHSFDFKSPAPDPRCIQPEDLLGVAALVFTGSYNDHKFVRPCAYS